MSAQFDIVIVGKGLVGTSLAILLKQSNLSVALIDEKPLSAFDDKAIRPISLNHSSYTLLKNAGLSLDHHATAIKQVHVSEKGSFSIARIEASDYAVPALGHVINISHLIKILDDNTATLENVRTFQPAKVTHVNFTQQGATLSFAKDNQSHTINCKLLVAADGSYSTLRKLMGIACIEEDYHEHALSAVISLQRHHDNIAYERFTECGTIAMLPMQHQRVGMVWAIPNEKKEAILTLTDEQFLKTLQQLFGFRLGKFLAITPRQCFPLRFIKTQEQARPHAIILGNAAHTLHPIAAQGFNLGLQDAAQLATLLTDGIKHDLLQRYEQLRSPQQQQTIFLTHFAHTLYSSHNPLIKKIRRMGLGAVGTCPTFKRFVAKFGMGVA